MSGRELGNGLDSPVPTASGTVVRGTSEAQPTIDEDLVRDLLDEQHPDLASMPLRPAGSGWDNVTYRLGEELAVRLPRGAEAASRILKERNWVPVLARRLPVRVQVPLRNGEPSERFPWPWTVVPWIHGSTADLSPPDPGQARLFASFLEALHRPAPRAAPRDELRGVALAERTTAVKERLTRLRHRSDSIGPAVLGAWEEALAVPEASTSCWLHGDLHARNVIVESGAIRGVIDWGDLGAGDAATDLAGSWAIFGERSARAEVVARYEPSDALLARARGWAVFFGVVLLDAGRGDHPAHVALGERILRRLGEDATGGG